MKENGAPAAEPRLWEKKKAVWSTRRLMVEHLDDRDYFMQKCLDERLTTECSLMLVKEWSPKVSPFHFERFSFTCVRPQHLNRAESHQIAVSSSRIYL